MAGLGTEGFGFVQPDNSSFILSRAGFQRCETSMRLTGLIVAFDVGGGIASVREKSVYPNTLASGYGHIRRKTLKLLTEDHRSVAPLV